MLWMFLYSISILTWWCISSSDTTTKLDIEFSDSSYSSYNILLNGKPWLSSGMTGFRNGGQWAPLEFNQTQQSSGQDIFGEYNDLIIIWRDKMNPMYEFHTIFRSYPNDPDMIIFIQYYPFGANSTINNNGFYIISSFPSFRLNNSDLGYVQWAGDFGGYYIKTGKWDSNNPSRLPGAGLDYGDGPICIFDKEMNNSLVISPLTDHMAASNYVTKIPSPDYFECQFGLIGGINNIQSGYSIKFILSATKNGGGVNEAMKNWGDKQLKYHNKMRMDQHHSRDFTLNYLGYNTANGGYYYYYTEPDKNYQETLIDVKKYHDNVGLPTKWILLDSWWYYKGKNNGVYNWTSMPNIFPNGLRYLYKSTNWRVMAHNRYWSLDNVYAGNIPGSNSSGKYNFTWGNNTSALPLQYEFWQYLFDINMDWGLTVYEQDWLLTSMQQIPLLSSSITFGKQWLKQMDNAAFKHNLCIQYCMDITRYLMTTVELLSVTQARVSGDYHPGNNQWQIGVTSIFALALDIAPSKDSYWSMPNLQNQPYGNGTSEPFNRLQSLVLTLSNGPITFSDRIGYSNVDLIMKCCSKSGLLLRPDISATMINLLFIEQAFSINGIMSEGNHSQIWTTYSNIPAGFKYIYLFSVLLTKNYQIYPNDISQIYSQTQNDGNDENDKWLAFETNNTAILTLFDQNNPLKLKQSGSKWDFEFYTMIPIGNETSGDWLLQGEIDKWIKVSKQRFKQITRNDNGDLFVRIVGQMNETVNIGFIQIIDNDKYKQQIVTCTFDETQEIVIKMPDGICDYYLLL